jgi:hypothetical protein
MRRRARARATVRASAPSYQRSCGTLYRRVVCVGTRGVRLTPPHRMNSESIVAYAIALGVVLGVTGIRA